MPWRGSSQHHSHRALRNWDGSCSHDNLAMKHVHWYLEEGSSL